MPSDSLCAIYMDKAWAVLKQRSVLYGTAAVLSVATLLVIPYVTKRKLIAFPYAGRQSLNKLIAQSTSEGNHSKIILNLHDKHGPVVALSGMFVMEALLVADPVIIHHILRDFDHFERSRKIMEFLTDLRGKFVFALNGEEWKHHRQAMVKATKLNNVRFGFAVSRQKVEEMIQLWGNADEITIDSVTEIMKCTLDISGLEFLSYDFGMVTRNDITCLEMSKAFEKAVMKRLGIPKWIAPIIKPFTKRDYKVFAWFDAITENAIKDKLARTAAGEKSKEGHEDLLDTLLAAKDFTPRDIKSELEGAWMAAKDTTAISACVMIETFAQFPDVANRARAEVRSEFGDSKEPVQAIEDLAKLPYLDALIKEILRYWNVAGVLMRIVREDFQTADGKVIPKGTTVFVSSLAVHLNDEFYPEASTFKPERWLNSEEWLKPGTFLAFSDGPQRCLGERFAYVTLKVLAVTILSHFSRIEHAPGQEPMVEKKNGLNAWGSRYYRLKRT